MSRAPLARRLVASAALAVSVLLAVPVTAAAAAPAADSTLIVRDLPSRVRLIPGEKVKLVLPTNVTTGYQWLAQGGCCTKGGQPVVTISKGVYAPPASTGGSTMVGATGTTTWTIKAVRPGKTQVTIVTRPPGVTNTMQDETVGVLTITVHSGG